MSNVTSLDADYLLGMSEVEGDWLIVVNVHGLHGRHSAVCYDIFLLT